MADSMHAVLRLIKTMDMSFEHFVVTSMASKPKLLYGKGRSPFQIMVSGQQCMSGTAVLQPPNVSFT